MKHLLHFFFFFFEGFPNPIIIHQYETTSSLKIFLVSGGREESSDLIDSTELFILGSWQESGRMPYAIYGLVGTTLDNNVYMLGMISNIT